MVDDFIRADIEEDAGADSEGGTVAADLTARVTITVARGVDEVFAMVTDLSRMGEWSPACKACWLDDGAEFTVGAWFTGRNEDNGQFVETRSQIVAVEPGRVFAFQPGGDLVRWQYDFAELRSCAAVTESWTLLPAGVAMFHKVFGADAAAQIEDKRRWAREGMTQTLSAIKRVAEAGA